MKKSQAKTTEKDNVKGLCAAGHSAAAKSTSQIVIDQGEGADVGTTTSGATSGTSKGKEVRLGLVGQLVIGLQLQLEFKFKQLEFELRLVRF